MTHSGTGEPKGDRTDWLALAETAMTAATRAGADAAEALVVAEDSALTRFANSEIHQNVAESNVQLGIRVIVGRRSGVATTDRTDAEGVARAAETALTLARLSEEREEAVALATPSTEPATPLEAAYAEATADATPELRAEIARAAIAAADDAGVSAFGTMATALESIAVASSTGIRASGVRTWSRMTVVCMGANGGTGYAEAAAVDVTAVDGAGLGQEAANGAVRSANPVALEPGDYPVVLLPYAVADILGTLAYTGFSALAVQEGRSFMEPGRRLGSDLVTIWDDGRDPTGLPMAFDYEGVPKQRVVAIDRGISGSPFYDAQTASREGRTSTGQALPAPNAFGPYPLNVFMAAGDATLDELLAGLDRGILITRFWYTNPVQPKLGITTGMTRDGTFLVERGEIVAAVKNLRFTHSYLDALREVDAVSRDRRIVMDGPAASVVPAIRVRRFTFTGATGD